MIDADGTLLEATLMVLWSKRSTIVPAQLQDALAESRLNSLTNDPTNGLTTCK